jgi:hypothetical protein
MSISPKKSHIHLEQVYEFVVRHKRATGRGPTTQWIAGNCGMTFQSAQMYTNRLIHADRVRREGTHVEPRGGLHGEMNGLE